MPLHKLTAALVAVFLCLNFAYAETSIKFGGISHHLSEGDYNSFHRTFIVSHNQYFAGYFRNSYDDDSFAIGYTFNLKEDSLFRFGLHTGLVYGYRDSSGCYKKQKERWNDPKRVCFMVSPSALAKRLPVQPSLEIMTDAWTVHFNYQL